MMEEAPTTIYYSVNTKLDGSDVDWPLCNEKGTTFILFSTEMLGAIFFLCELPVADRKVSLRKRVFFCALPSFSVK